MSGSSRKRNSKWDLKEESRIPFEDVDGDAWPGKAGMSFHEKKSHGWFPPVAASGNRSKWPATEPLHSRRGSHRDDNIDEDRNRTLKAMATWDEDESYGTRMSPGLDEWRQQRYHHSPKNEWKRSRRSWSRSGSRSSSRSRSPVHGMSRSRSPVHGFRRESGVYDRNRSKSGLSAQLCKDFAAGRCRRGDHCHFLHQGTQSYEDGWERHKKPLASKYSISHDSREYPTGSSRSADCCTEFLKGNCRRGASCRYAHHDASDASVKGSINEITRERDDDRRHRHASPERRGERETRRAADVPCKFFAAGNCRNGRYCKFSHNDLAHVSPDNRSRDGKWLPVQNSDDVGKMWRDTNTSDAAKLSENNSEKMDAPGPRLPECSVDDRWGHSLDENKTQSDQQNNKLVESKSEALRWKTENAGDSMHVSEQRTSENWPGDMDMSPDWNYRVQPSNLISKGGVTSLRTCEPVLTQEAPKRLRDASAVVPPMLNETSSIQQDYNWREVGASSLLHDDKGLTGLTVSSHVNVSASNLTAHILNQNGLSSNPLPIPSLNAVGHSKMAMLTEPSKGGSMVNTQNQTIFLERKAINKADIGDAVALQMNSRTPTQNIVNGEQFSQLTTLSASLAQLLANGQQLPQIYAAHNPLISINSPSLADSEGPVKPDSAVTIQPNLVVGHPKRHDPVCDSIELERRDVSNNPPSSLPKLNVQKSIADGKLEMLSKKLSPQSFDGAANGGVNDKFRSLEEPNNKSFQLNQPEAGPNSEVAKGNDGLETQKSRKVQEDNKTAEEPLENIDKDGKPDENKKSKDVKGIRAFKFALVENVKELLKPTWKEGQMSKDAYKNIVKKVVDKVTGTIQGSNVPQTQEKIEQYLTLSKPKLTKLVLAYVEKAQKDK